MKKIEWMFAAGTVAAIAGAVYSAGCVNTASDCALLGTCGNGGGASTTSSTTATGTTSSTGTGGPVSEGICEVSRFGDAQAQAATSVLVGPSNDLLLSGSFLGSLSLGIKTVNASGASPDLFVARMSEGQTLKWLKSFPVRYGAVARDAKGGIVLAGSYDTKADFGAPCAPLDGNDNFYVAKLDIDGTCQWAKGFKFSATEVHAHLAVGVNDQIALVGDAEGSMDFHDTDAGTLQLIGNNPGKKDIFAVELGAMGNVQSTVGFGGPNDDVAGGVAYDAAGGMVLTGSFTSPQIDFGSGLLKSVNAQDSAFVVGIGGTKNWSLGYPFTKGAQHPTAVVVNGAQAIVAGDYTGSLGTLMSSGTDFFVLGVDTATGKPAWSKTFEGKGKKSIRAITVGDGGVALAASIDEKAGYVDFGFGKLSELGTAIVATVSASDGAGLSSLAFGDGASLPVASGVSFQGSSLFVAGAFSATFKINKDLSVENAGATDGFLAKLSTSCP